MYLIVFPSFALKLLADLESILVVFCMFVCLNWSLTHSLIHNFETVSNSKKLQTTTEMWLQSHRKHCGKR